MIDRVSLLQLPQFLPLPSLSLSLSLSKRGVTRRIFFRLIFSLSSFLLITNLILYSIEEKRTTPAFSSSPSTSTSSPPTNHHPQWCSKWLESLYERPDITPESRLYHGCRAPVPLEAENKTPDPYYHPSSHPPSFDSSSSSRIIYLITFFDTEVFSLRMVDHLFDHYQSFGVLLENFLVTLQTTRHIDSPSAGMTKAQIWLKSYGILPRVYSGVYTADLKEQWNNRWLDSLRISWNDWVIPIDMVSSLLPFCLFCSCIDLTSFPG
jgi:hypothetical protein